MDHELSNQRSVFLFLSCSEHYCLSSFFVASKHCIRFVYFITYCVSSLKISSSCKMSVIRHIHEDYLGVEEVWRIFYFCFLYNTAKLNKAFVIVTDGFPTFWPCFLSLLSYWLAWLQWGCKDLSRQGIGPKCVMYPSRWQLSCFLSLVSWKLLFLVPFFFHEHLCYFCFSAC